MDWHQIFAKPPPDERRRPKRQPVSLAEATSVRFVKPKEKEDDKEGREKEKKELSSHRPSSKPHPPARADGVRKMYNPATGAEVEKKGVEKKRERPNELTKLKTAILEERAHLSLQLTPSSSQPIIVTSESISTATSSSKEAPHVHIKTVKDARTVSLQRYRKDPSAKTKSSAPPSHEAKRGWKSFDIPRNFNPLFLHHIITPQYITLVSSMLDKLVTYQARAAANSNAGKRKKGIRFVSGLSHSIRSLSLRRSKMIILAMDIEDSTSLQALVSTMWAEKLKIQLSSFNAPPELLSAFNAISTALGAQTGISSWTGHSNASPSDVPFLFVPSRRLLAKYIHKRIPCSAISIVNVDGAHEEWKRLSEEVLPSLASMASNMLVTQITQAVKLQRSQELAQCRMNLVMEEVAEKQKKNKGKPGSPPQGISYVSRFLCSFNGTTSILPDSVLAAAEKKKAGISKTLSSASHRHFEAILPKGGDLDWSEELGSRISAVRVMIEEEKESNESGAHFSPSLGTLTAEILPIRLGSNNHQAHLAEDDASAYLSEVEIDTNFEAFPILPCYHQPFILKTKHDASSFPTLWTPQSATKKRADGIGPNALLIVLSWFSSFIGCISKEGNLGSTSEGDEVQTELSKTLLTQSVLLHLPPSESTSSSDSIDTHLNLDEFQGESSEEEGEEESNTDEEEDSSPSLESQIPTAIEAPSFKVNLEQSESTRLFLRRLGRDAKGLFQSSFASFFLLRASLPLFFHPQELDPSSWAILNALPTTPSSNTAKSKSSGATSSAPFDPQLELILFVQLAPQQTQQLKPLKGELASSPHHQAHKDRFNFVPPFQRYPSIASSHTHVIRMKKTDTIFELIGKVARAVQMAPKNVSLSLCDVPLSLLTPPHHISSLNSSTIVSDKEETQGNTEGIEKVEEGEDSQVENKKAFLSLTIESISSLTHLSTLIASTRTWK